MGIDSSGIKPAHET